MIYWALLVFCCNPQDCLRVERQVTFAWDAPTMNTDGTELTDLAGYNLYGGPQPRAYETVIQLGTDTTYSYVPGKEKYFAVTAVNERGGESAYSNEVILPVATCPCVNKIRR